MSDNDTDELESTNQATEEVEKTEEIEETDVQPESEDLEALRERNKHLFERTKKAEAEAKLLKAERLKQEEQVKARPKVESPKDGISSMDAIALIKAEVTEKEDIDEVVDYAKLKNISIAEALKSNVVKSIIKDKVEVRTSAAATNTGTARRGTAKPSADMILSNADKGTYPDDAEDLAEARMAEKLNSIKK